MISTPVAAIHPVHGGLIICMKDSKMTAQDVRPSRSLWDIRARLEENFRRVETLLGEMEAAQDSRMRLAAAAELRQHLALAEKTLETLSKVEAVRAFEETVLDALGAASAKVRRKVMELLDARIEAGGVPSTSS